MSDKPKRTRRRSSALWGKIRDQADAEQLINDSSMAYFLLAVVLAVIALISSTNVWIDALVYAGLGYWLYRFQTITPVLILFVLAFFVFIATFLDRPGANIQGRNALLGVFMIWTSGRALEATYKLPKLPDVTLSNDH